MRGPDAFSDISQAVGCQDFRCALLLMRKAGAAARERFPGWHAQHENGVSAIVRFTENADEFLARMKGRVNFQIKESGTFGRSVEAATLKAWLRREAEGLVANGIYRMQYELACMSVPPVENGKMNGVNHHISEMFRASNDVSPRLGEFLDSISIPREEYVEALEALRGTLLSRGPTNAEIRTDKERLAAVFISFMEGYLHFRLSGSPRDEGILK